MIWFAVDGSRRARDLAIEKTGRTMTAIQKVSGVIRDVNDIVSTIAAALTQQSAATQEIVSNITSLSQGIREANENVSQGSAAAGNITREIGGVNAAKVQMKHSSSLVMQSASRMSSMAEELKRIVNTFKV